MSYDIFSPIAPKMPKLGKGTHTLTLALSQTSAEMREPIAAMIIPVMASLITASSSSTLTTTSMRLADRWVI